MCTIYFEEVTNAVIKILDLKEVQLPKKISVFVIRVLRRLIEKENKNS